MPGRTQAFMSMNAQTDDVKVLETLPLMLMLPVTLLPPPRFASTAGATLVQPGQRAACAHRLHARSGCGNTVRSRRHRSGT
jgi:hypothetical protein